jgi:glycosyltransferase involved in cell wall biosynthesis
MRVCLVYDCLYPYTVGGAERWYRNLALRLAADGHDVTYLTRRQWKRQEPPVIAGVRVVAVSPATELYTSGRRRLLPPLAFGLGVLRHLLVHGGRYDVVHTASFPYFSLLAAWTAATAHRYRIVVDWHEVWTDGYWREYLGRGGAVGAAIQRLCLRVPQQAFCFSELHAHRLASKGVNGRVVTLRGQYAGRAAEPTPPALRVVYAGRHVPEKRVTAIVPAVLAARERVPGLGAAIYGDGPDRIRVLQQIAGAGGNGTLEAPGFVPQDVVEHGIGSSLCLVLPSQREGYGLVVVEAVARGTPVVVVAGPDNAAVELVEAGVNGYVATSAEPAELADAIAKIFDAGEALRRSTREWFSRHERDLSIEASLDAVAAAYREATRD